MVLGELGNRLTTALNRLNQTTIVDDEVVSSMLQDISRALLESDVNVKIVVSLRNKIKTRLAMDQEGAGINKRKLVQRVVTEELVCWNISSLMIPNIDFPFPPPSDCCSEYRNKTIRNEEK
jgi:signal recognition particle subunit SRP54